MTTNRLLIFDLDGTLLDTMGPLADLFCEMWSRRGVPESVSRPIYVREMGKGPRPQFVEVLKATESMDEALADRLTAQYWAASEAFVPSLFPETTEVLESLRVQGHTLVVSSGGRPEFVARNTQLTGIDRLFRLLLGTDAGVPHMVKGPGHFRLIREALALHDGDLRQRGVFVGDGVYDMEVARAAGILAVGRLAGDNGSTLREAGADHLISSLSELGPILGAR
ncbi:MAG TPA: HAD family hydrolase [Longimicrobiales bacterium]|nr:HAD family hydrolase [Longimicrobiales bacterium]